MGLLNIDNCSKTVVFKTSKCLLYKHYHKYFQTFKNHPNKFDVSQFLVLLYDYVPNIKNCYSINRLLKNVNILQVGTGKNLTTPLHSDIKKVKI